MQRDAWNCNNEVIGFIRDTFITLYDIITITILSI